MAGVQRTETRIAGFASSEMDFQLMRQLGAVPAGGGAPGEIFAARARIDGDDPFAWPAAFAGKAEALERLARDALDRGHTVTAAHHLLRASSYYRSAEYFTDPFQSAHREYGVRSRETFLRASPHLRHAIEPVDIPFGSCDLPGYFLAPEGGAPGGRTVVLMTGFDGTGEELYFQSAADGLARGFNVLIAEGPGQVGALRRHPDLWFRPDYEVPVAAILDYGLSRPEVGPDKLALYGISFGGYFVTRAAAHDPRPKALVANSPIVDLRAYVRGFAEGSGDAAGADDDVTLAEVDEVPDDLMSRATKLSFKSACRRFGVQSFSAWLEALEAYRVTDRLEHVACPSLGLVGTGEGEEARRQHDLFCDRVSGPVTSRIFRAEEGADMHCQLGNLPLSNAVVYDWLAETFS